MELSALTGKVYYEVRFEDIPSYVPLAARCGCCGHEAPVDREHLQKRSQEAYLRFAARFVRCTKCSNIYHNRIFALAAP